MTKRSSVLDVGDYRSLIQRRWRWLIWVPLVVLAVAVAATAARRPVYTASADVLILTESSRTLFPFTAQTADQLARRPFAELQFLDGDRYRSAVPSPGAVSVELVPISEDRGVEDSDVIRFTAQASTAEAAADLADTHAQRYLELRHEQDLSQILVQLERLDAVLDELSTEPAQDELPEREAQRQATSLERGLLAQTLLELGADGAAAQIHNPAVLPSSPTSPDLTRNLVFGGFAGVVLGVGLAIARELFDPRAFDPETVMSSVGLPILGIVERRSSIGAESAWGESSSDGYQTILNSLWLRQSGEPVQTLLVTGTNEGVGVTETALNLAALEARQGVSVLLVDAYADERYLNVRLLAQVRPEPDAVSDAPASGEADADTADHPDDETPGDDAEADADTADHPDDETPGDDAEANTYTEQAPWPTYAEIFTEIHQVDGLVADLAADLAADLGEATQPGTPSSADDSSQEPQVAPRVPATATSIPNLYALRALAVRQGSGDLVRTEVLSRRLETLRSHFDLIVIDARPALGSTDIRPLAARSDAVMVVYEPTGDRLEHVQQAVDVLRTTGSNVVGLVASQAPSDHTHVSLPSFSFQGS